jgi:hypothetical protein
MRRLRVRLLICCDVDGTLDSSAGPVPVERLRELDHLPGCRVVIVSPSAARPSGFTEQVGDDRQANLAAAADLWRAPLRLYLSDNGDREIAQAAGFTYIDPSDFR